jgi:hypothetical protein
MRIGSILIVHPDSKPTKKKKKTQATPNQSIKKEGSSGTSKRMVPGEGSTEVSSKT